MTHTVLIKIIKAAPRISQDGSEYLARLEMELLVNMFRNFRGLCDIRPNRSRCSRGIYFRINRIGNKDKVGPQKSILVQGSIHDSDSSSYISTFYNRLELISKADNIVCSARHC